MFFVDIFWIHMDNKNLTKLLLLLRLMSSELGSPVFLLIRNIWVTV